MVEAERPLVDMLSTLATTTGINARKQGLLAVSTSDVFRAQRRNHGRTGSVAGCRKEDAKVGVRLRLKTQESQKTRFLGYADVVNCGVSGPLQKQIQVKPFLGQIVRKCKRIAIDEPVVFNGGNKGACRLQ